MGSDDSLVDHLTLMRDRQAVLGGQLTVQIQAYINYWLSVAVMGTAATGIYAACMSVVAAANPFLSGLGNILTPRAVLAWRNGGGEQLRAQAIRDCLLLGLATGLFCVLVLLGGEGLIRLLYRGNDCARVGDLVTALSLALLAQVIGVPASNGFGR